MLRPLLARAAAALAAAALLAGPACAADPAFPLASHIGLVAPGAMQASPNFRGFMDRASRASSLIVELPPEAATKIAEEMTPEAIKRQGMTEEKRETVTLKTGQALLVVGEQPA